MYDHVFCFYFKDDNLSWMMAESLRLKEEGKLPNEGFYGGILIDEMAIQQDLTIVKKGKSMHLIGNVNLGPTLAKYALQFLYLGHTGFRWPIAHYPCNGAQAHELFVIFWQLVDKLKEYGFETDYVSVDGAISNRQFIKLRFPDYNPEK